MNKKQLLELKRQAHNLNPVVIIGQHGLSEAVHNEIECALDAHELIKIRINARDADHRQSMLDTICAQHHAVLVQKIGHIVAIYRKKPD